jgi:UDP-N-acetylglucosamine 4-epimerase
MIQGRSPIINGNGEQSRDYTFVDNISNINASALFNENPESWNQIYNAACGQKTSLNDLYHLVANLVGYSGQPVYGPQRIGEIQDSLADISKAKRLLGYFPEYSIETGLKRTFSWYERNQAFLLG